MKLSQKMIKFYHRCQKPKVFKKKPSELWSTNRSRNKNQNLLQVSPRVQALRKEDL